MKAMHDVAWCRVRCTMCVLSCIVVEFNADNEKGEVYDGEVVGG